MYATHTHTTQIPIQKESRALSRLHRRARIPIHMHRNTRINPLLYWPHTIFNWCWKCVCVCACVYMFILFYFSFCCPSVRFVYWNMLQHVHTHNIKTHFEFGWHVHTEAMHSTHTSTDIQTHCALTSRVLTAAVLCACIWCRMYEIARFAGSVSPSVSLFTVIAIEHALNIYFSLYLMLMFELRYCRRSKISIGCEILIPILKLFYTLSFFLFFELCNDKFHFAFCLPLIVVFPSFVLFVSYVIRCRLSSVHTTNKWKKAKWQHDQWLREKESAFLWVQLCNTVMRMCALSSFCNEYKTVFFLCLVDSCALVSLIFLGENLIYTYKIAGFAKCDNVYN